MRRREMAGCGHPLPFAAAAGLALGLALFAHQLLLTLAAVVIGPLPAVQTALYLSRKDLSEAAAQAVSEPAQETQAEPAQEAPALPAGDIEAYLVPLEGDEARPEGAGAILEKNYPQGSGGEIHSLRQRQHQEQHQRLQHRCRRRDHQPAPLCGGVEQPRPADPHHAHSCH